MLHKISKSFICCLLFLSVHSISYAEGISVVIHNESGSGFTLTGVELRSGNWSGRSPSSIIADLTASWYGVTRGWFEGPEATSVYRIDGTEIELLTYVNSNYWNLAHFNTRVCLRKINTTKDCATTLGGYNMEKVEKSEGYDLEDHYLDVYITNPGKVHFEDLCSDASRRESKKLINGVIALDTTKFGDKSYGFYGENGKVIGIAGNTATDIALLDSVKTAYLTGIPVTYCYSPADNLEQLVIRR